MSKFSKKPISEWKYGEEFERYISNLSLGYIVSLEDEFFTIEMTRAYDGLYYALLDMKALRKKWLKENVKHLDDGQLNDV